MGRDIGLAHIQLGKVSVTVERTEPWPLGMRHGFYLAIDLSTD
jgi:hypothetical protein